MFPQQSHPFGQQPVPLEQQSFRGGQQLPLLHPVGQVAGQQTPPAAQIVAGGQHRFPQQVLPGGQHIGAPAPQPTGFAAGQQTPVRQLPHTAPGKQQKAPQHTGLAAVQQKSVPQQTPPGGQQLIGKPSQRTVAPRHAKLPTILAPAPPPF